MLWGLAYCHGLAWWVVDLPMQLPITGPCHSNSIERHLLGLTFSHDMFMTWLSHGYVSRLTLVKF